MYFGSLIYREPTGKLGYLCLPPIAKSAMDGAPERLWWVGENGSRGARMPTLARKMRGRRWGTRRRVWRRSALIEGEGALGG